MRLARPVAALGAAGLLALAGCGEKRETATGASGGSGPVTISETEFKIDPAGPSVQRSGPVEIVVENNGHTDHALEIETPGGDLKTGTIAPGESATIRADLKPGSYEIYCPIDGHREKGMEGELEVAGGGSGDDGGSSGGGSSGGY